jgi:carbon storage regulator
MLVLSRKLGEQIVIGENIVLTIVQVQGSKVRLGVEAPADVSIHRLEIHQRIQDQSRHEARTDERIYVGGQ